MNCLLLSCIYRSPHKKKILLENPLLHNSGKYDGTEVEYNDEECQIVRDDNVLLAYQGVTMRLDNVIPIRDYVLIALDDDNDDDDAADGAMSTASGVVIAGQVMQNDLPCEGVVVKVGEGRMCGTGELMQSPVQPGDRVKYKDYAGNEVLIEGKGYVVVKMVDILATYVGSSSDANANDAADTKEP